MRSAAYVPALEGMPRHNSDGIGGMHCIRRGGNSTRRTRTFPRGYHIEIGGGFGMPQLGRQRAARTAYGKELKDSIRQQLRRVSASRGTRRDDSERAFVLRDRSHCRRSVGHPGARFHFRWSEHEINMVKHMHHTFTDMIETMGGRVTSPAFPENAITAVSVGGDIIHEAGTVRMGARSRRPAF